MLLPTLVILAALQTPPAHSAGSAAPGSAKPSVTATLAQQAPVIDGRDDDAVWQIARETSDFRQFSPKVGGDPAFRTRFRVAYDARNLYVFVRMEDPHPDSIMHALSRRDVRGPSDQIKLLIDSYDDKRSGYELAVMSRRVWMHRGGQPSSACRSHSYATAVARRTRLALASGATLSA
jgi:Carbohydrate family 9 binding domain-like